MITSFDKFSNVNEQIKQIYFSISLIIIRYFYHNENK